MVLNRVAGKTHFEPIAVNTPVGTRAVAAPPPVPVERTRILFVVNSLAFGGAEKHLVTLLNHFDASQFRLSLAYLKNDSSLLMQLKQDQLDGRVFCCAVARRIDVDAARHLGNLIRDEGIEIVVAVNCYALLYASLARKLSGTTPRLIDIFHSSQLLSWKTRAQMLCYRPLFARCDMLVYVCENQRTYWHDKSLKAKNDAVIHNGIELSRFTDCYTDTEKIRVRQRYGWSGDDFVIGLCAAMRPEKAHTDLLHALASLPASLMHVRCLLIGDGPERARIEKTVIALGLAHRVAITGYLPDVRPAIAACDVMALVSHSETFSLAALEAMALSKPLIMSEVGGAAEQIDDGVDGFLVKAGDIGALAQRIAGLAISGAAKAMGQAARRKVLKRYSHLRMAAAYESLFKRLAPPK